MCSPTTCRSCSKTTWTGCGQHVAQVMRNVPAAQQCSCTGNDRAGGSLFARILGR